MFFGKIGRKIGLQTNFPHIKICIPQIDLSNEVWYASNGIVCQSYVPEKLKHQFTQTRPIVLALHLLGFGFWMFRVIHCFSIINRPSSLIVTQFRGLQPPHLFSEIATSALASFVSILFVSKFQFFDINEMKCYFHCISVFMVICLFCCVPA